MTQSSETVENVDPAVEQVDAPDGAADDAPTKRRMSRRMRIGLIIIGAVAVISLVALGLNWLLNANRYVTTDNAQIDGTQLTITAPASGTLTNWTVSMGSQLTAGAPVGRIAAQTGYLQPQTLIKAPADGVVAVNNGVNGAFVPAGTSLAIAYNPDTVFVTARVDETNISSVKVGQQVDISVDAFPGTSLTGHVAEIKTGAAGVFSLFGQSNTTGNFQKVTQVIAVKVTIDDRRGLALVPGMNVTAKIEK